MDAVPRVACLADLVCWCWGKVFVQWGCWGSAQLVGRGRRGGGTMVLEVSAGRNCWGLGGMKGLLAQGWP